MNDKFLSPYTGDNLKLIRLGRQKDGGYVIPDHPVLQELPLLSAGIGEETSFDHDYCERYNTEVWQFDRTVKKPGVIRQNIYSLDDFWDHVPQAEYALSMDIEGSEWAVLRDSTPGDWSLFPIITLEAHEFH